MRIAIIGTGISSNTVAYYLNKDHDITVFESNDYIGGHTHTHEIEHAGKRFNIDTGFIVFNYRTYPNFTNILNELNVGVQPSHMSFSVRDDYKKLEYNGTSINSLFSQRRNILRPSFYRMIADILRFNKESLQLLEQEHSSTTLGEYLSAEKYSREFIDHYIIPMGAAVWSTDPASMFSFPAQFFVRFFKNHGMLSVNERPQWYVIKGGSKQYLKKMTASYRAKIKLKAPVEWIKREANQVLVKAKGHDVESFDYVFNGAHSDQALKMLVDPTPNERKLLGALPYQSNEVLLHTDESVLPNRRLSWAAWNYHIGQQPARSATLTYNMNILQSIEHSSQFCVTLNQTEAIAPSKVLKTLNYSHPLFTPESISAQQQHREINGSNRIYYVGAYWGYGFHEDGVNSALTSLEHFNDDTQNEQQNLRRAS
jgi:predicted NAD/FAD-binding protein